ncbi:hypothetical protein [Bradyrhizobium sp. AC87j1]|uniref:DUF7662 domain-containing protein n=1 Tax=Bradyrhizobium sp. AC87j1 TaxID=2055894 RepID=UPI00191C2E5B|nr:hypothetical protein [Bradyrhizobium sp. AC87j1]
MTAEEAETIAARIFERITDLNLEIAARHIASASRVDKVTRPVVESVYDPLCQWLLSTRGQAVRLTFSEIEEILRRPLPASAYRFSAWWGNESSRKAGHTQAFAWLKAGFKAKVSLKQRAVEFDRT